MTGVRISGLPAQTEPIADDDLFEMVDRSDTGISLAGRSTRVTFATLRQQLYSLLREPARCVVTTAVTLSTAIVAGATVAGLTLVAGDRVLVTAQVDPGDNGLWEVASAGAPTRPYDFLTGSSVASALVIVQAGTGGDSVWLCTADTGSDVVGINAVPFVRISGTVLASTTTNDSSVAGATVKNALETLAAAITANAGSVTTLAGRVTVNEADILSLQGAVSGIAVNTAAISELAYDVGILTGDVAALDTDLLALSEYVHVTAAVPQYLPDLLDVNDAMAPVPGSILQYQAGTWDAVAFSEAVDDRVALLLQGGYGIAVTYDDVMNTVTIAGISESAGGGMLPVDDTAAIVYNTLDASKRVRLDAGALTAGTTRVIQMADENIDLAPGASFAAAAHVHTPADIIGFSEAVDDRVATLLIAGAGIILTYDDVLNTLTVTADGGAAAFTPLVGKPADYEPPATGYALFDKRNQRPVLVFAAAALETAIWTFVMPASYSGGDLVLTIIWCVDTASVGTVTWAAVLERTRTGGGTNVDVDAWASIPVSALATAAGASPVKTQLTLTTGARGGVAAGDVFRLRVQRTTVGSSTAAAQLLAASIAEA